MDRYVGHLPGVRFSDGALETFLAGGVLRQIPFDEWRQFDDFFPFRRRDYERGAPVFFEQSLGAPSDRDDAVAAFISESDKGSATRSSVYRTLLLASGSPIPNPAYSMSYYIWENQDQSGSFRRVGPANRELIVFAGELSAVTVGQSTGPALQSLEQLVVRSRGALVGLVDAISRTTRPGFGVMNQVLHLVAGLEPLLVRRGERLTETFARRFAVLSAIEHAHEYYAAGRMLYALRSDLIHGRPFDLTSLAEADDFLTRQFRVLACQMAIRAMHMLDGNEDMTQFHYLLDATFDDPNRLQDLVRAWDES